MPRAPRKQSESGYYHVIARGSGRQNIFEDDSDRYAFLRMMRKSLHDNGIAVLAWCLMSNHVHLLVYDPERKLSKAMQVLLRAYAVRFNEKSGHVGHVFQERFISEPIESDSYLLEAVRYIHANPFNAGICPTDQYPWSSYREYASTEEPEFTDTGLILELLGGPVAFEAFINDIRCRPYRDPMRRFMDGDDGGRRTAQQIIGDIPLAALKTLSVERRNEFISMMRESGLSIRQIERLTGIGRNTIARSTR